MSNLLLDSVAKGDLIVTKVNLVKFSAANVSTALKKKLAGGFTGKQVVKLNTA
jgi:hypothetical protein